MSTRHGRTAKTLGVNDAALRNSGRRTHRDLDPQGLLTPDVVRGFIDASMCPYCPAGPFVALAGHTNRAHGIDRHELRAAAHLSGRQPISSPEYRRACQERGRRIGFGVGVDASAAGKKARETGQGNMTKAGIDRQRENIKHVQQSMTKEKHSAARAKAWQTLVATGRSDEKVAQLHRDKSGRSPAEVEAIVREVRDLGLGVNEVIERYGYSRSGAHNIVHRAKAG